MEREEFHHLLRDLLSNIHDYAVLEKHPLSAYMPRGGASVSRADALRRFVSAGVETLRPPETQPRLESLEWRYYLILHGRYVEGAGVADLQNRLALGERQERRLHGRALDALENILWDRLSKETAATTPGMEPAAAGQETAAERVVEEQNVTFQVTPEPLELERVLQEVAAVCATRVQSRGAALDVDLPANLPEIRADRVILRQILLHVMGRALQVWGVGTIQAQARLSNGSVQLEVRVRVGENFGEEAREAAAFVPEHIAYWLERMSIRLAMTHDSQAGLACFRLVLPRVSQSTLLVVDDHAPAIRIIQRYLSHTGVQVVGVTDPAQVTTMARTAQPQAILLDVMMPGIDGWEVLQALKADPETQDIQVIICSVWNQPELAFSLGANGFLKKPISQDALLDALVHLNLLDTLAGRHPASS
jgi:CheY-like chemotaxis protein